jgi:transposase InsO family protein
MTNDPKDPADDSELIQRAVDALIAGASAQKISQPGSKPEAKSCARKGRRYAASEKKAILAAAKTGKKAEELETQFGVARETVSRWMRRESPGIAPVTPLADPVVSSQAIATTSATAELRSDAHKGYHSHWKEVLKVWRARPGIGPAQIRNQLHRVGIKITVATVRKILEENGYTPPKAAIKEIEINRYEAVRPLELVHMDFKHFYINRAKVYLLLLQDDFSRFLCGHRMTDSENMKAVIAVFEECVNRHGKMQAVMTDAGSAFYSWNGVNRFQKLLEGEYGVDQIKASTPRSNGKIENVNKQIEKEVLDVKMYASLAEADTAIREWVRFYNFERTHMGLPPGTVPADRFLPGWNESEPRKPVTSEASIVAAVPAAADAQAVEQQAWKEVMKFALSRFKRAA